MNALNSNFSVEIENTQRHCPIGEITGKEMMAQGKIPVISCEGSCIRGEIARLAANMLAKKEGYGRGCHGEFITVPQSAMARWANQSEKIVVIDGCFLHCHGRILINLFNESQLAVFDALSFYGKYTDIMDIDDVPESERKETAQVVLDKVLDAMEKGASTNCNGIPESSSGCCEINYESSDSCGSKVETTSCCGG